MANVNAQDPPMDPGRQTIALPDPHGRPGDGCDKHDLQYHRLLSTVVNLKVKSNGQTVYCCFACLFENLKINMALKSFEGSKWSLEFKRAQVDRLTRENTQLIIMNSSLNSTVDGYKTKEDEEFPVKMDLDARVKRLTEENQQLRERVKELEEYIAKLNPIVIDEECGIEGIPNETLLDLLMRIKALAYKEFADSIPAFDDLVDKLAQRLSGLRQNYDDTHKEEDPVPCDIIPEEESTITLPIKAKSLEVRRTQFKKQGSKWMLSVVLGVSDNDVSAMEEAEKEKKNKEKEEKEEKEERESIDEMPIDGVITEEEKETNGGKRRADTEENPTDAKKMKEEETKEDEEETEGDNREEVVQ